MSGIDSFSVPGVDGLERFAPEPKSFSVQGVVRTALQVASAVTGVPSTAGIDPDLSSLISQQVEIQKQMFLVSMVSNIEKSKHETEMAAVRNMRVG